MDMTLLTEQVPNFVFQFKLLCRYVNGAYPNNVKSESTFSILVNIADYSEHAANIYLQTVLMHLNGEHKRDYGLIEGRSIVVDHVELLGPPIPILVSWTNPRILQGTGLTGISIAKVIR